MPRTVDLHHDRGDGVCDYCLTEWPCGWAKSDRSVQNAGDWERELRNQAHERKRDGARGQFEQIEEACKLVGIECPVDIDDVMTWQKYVASPDKGRPYHHYRRRVSIYYDEFIIFTLFIYK